MANHLVLRFDAEVQKKDIRCDYLVDDSIQRLGIDFVLLDRSRLLQVLINLMTNAIKFTQDELKRSITVRLSASVIPTVPAAFDFEYIAQKNPDATTLDTGMSLRRITRATSCFVFHVFATVVYMTYTCRSPADTL